MDFEALLHRYKEAKTDPPPPTVEGRKKITAKQLMEMIAERQAKNKEDSAPPPPPPPPKPATPPPPDPSSFLFAGIRDAQRSIASILEATPAPILETPPPPPPRVIDTTDIEDHTAMFDSAPAQVEDLHAVVNDIRAQVRTEETQKYMSRIEIEDKVRACERMCRDVEEGVRQVKKRLYQIDLHFSYIRQIMAVDDEELQLYVDDMSANEDNIDKFYSDLNNPPPPIIEQDVQEDEPVITTEEVEPPPPTEEEEEEEDEAEQRFIVEDRVSQMRNSFLFRPVPVAPPTNRPGIMASSHDARFFSRFI